MATTTRKARQKVSDNKIPVLITTDHTKRGVFFGYIDPEDTTKDQFRAENVQMCVRWSSDMCGVLGLASKGPSKSCRVSASVAAGTISGVTLVVECTPEAVQAWEKQPWG